MYGYAPNSDLLQATTCYNSLNPVLTTTRTWNYGFQLQSIANVVNHSTVTSHRYQYDAVNRRTQAEDNSFWQYGYDDRNELTAANRYWADFNTVTPVAGQLYGYAYDNIGNRTAATFGGDTNGAHLQTISYTADSLNQYTIIQTPGLKDIIGAALATNPVTVNTGTADRHGEYFHCQISVPNTNQPVWQTVTNIAGTFTNQGGLVFPANNQTLVHDADGNLTFDGIWNYQWDGENRLISMNMTNLANIAASPTNRLRLDFTYDCMGRRMSKLVSTWTGSAFAPQSTNYFVYDGWNLVAILTAQSAILHSFMWGHDLSGTMNKAGGAGGLLLASISGANCFAAYDGNGNISAFINATDQSLAARYEYSPYGELLRATGALAHQNPFRFSTKYWDDESGLIYNNYRYYSPVSGRWINRDPSGEQDNVNLHGFVRNNPITRIDTNGKASVEDIIEDVLDYNYHNGMPIAEAIDAYAKEALTGEAEALSGILVNTIGGALTDKLAEILINPDVILSEMGEGEVASEVQEFNFDRNLQRIITNRLQSQNANNVMIGIVVGLSAAAANANGGDGDDLILDASINAAGTMVLILRRPFMAWRQT